MTGVRLALDVGERRIGVAVCDATGTLARPLQIIVRRSRADDFAEIARLAREHGAQAIVVGLPLNMDDGTRGPQAHRIERFARRLAAAVDVPVVLHDERLSSEIAGERLAAAGHSVRRPAAIDAHAAAVILQDYLDRHKVPSPDITQG